MTFKKQLIEEIELLLDVKSGFLSKLSKDDLMSLKEAIQSKFKSSSGESQLEPQYDWGIVTTECGEFKSSVGRSRGVSLQVAKATSLCAFAIVYWRLQKMGVIGLLGHETYVDSRGEGVIDLYDVTHYGIDGLSDSDPEFWCEMQVSGLGSCFFFWLPDLPPKMLLSPSKAIQDEHSVGNTELNGLLPPLMKSWKAIQDLQNPRYQCFQKIILNIDEICYVLYDIDDHSSIDIIDLMIEQIATQPQSFKMLKPKEIEKKLGFEEATAELIRECLLEIQSACIS